MFELALDVFKAEFHVSFDVFVFDFGVHEILFSEETFAVVPDVFETFAAGEAGDSMSIDTMSVKNTEYFDIIVNQNEQIILVHFSFIAFVALKLNVPINQYLFQVGIWPTKMISHIPTLQKGLVVVE